MCDVETKRQVLLCLHELLAQNVRGGIQYDNRYKGFRGELDYFRRCRARGINLYCGGYFLPTAAGGDTLDNPVYFTVTDDPLDDSYLAIYERVARLGCEALYFVRYDAQQRFSEWEVAEFLDTGAQIRIPRFETFRYDETARAFRRCEIAELIERFREGNGFTPDEDIPAELRDRHLNNLVGFDLEDLTDMYVQRLVFDGMIGLRRVRGLPSDIDGIVCRDGEPTAFVEVKEKDLSRRPPQGFGMDVRRIENLRRIEDVTGVPYHYVVRQVNNQTDRHFVAWLRISISDFWNQVQNNQTIIGGTGMRSVHSQNPTLVCPVEFFRVID